ncbi:hypothetical protein ACFE04_023257 [Oxalis oulophora]
MPDDIRGVSSPMVYISMFFSWFAWHVEDHELHSMNYLHTGSSKTWYSVPGDQAFAFEELIRTYAYGGNIDRLEETDNEENIRACFAGMESIVELSTIAVKKTCDVMNQKCGQLKSLNETVYKLVKEKEHIGSLLRDALSNRMVNDPSSKNKDLFEVVENGLREAGIDYTFSKVLGEDKVDGHEMEDEIYTLSGALEKIVKASQLEIIELQHSVE